MLLILRSINAICFSGLINVRHFIVIIGVRYNDPVTFKLHFQGPRFAVGDGYFVRSKGQTSQFERHVETVIKSFKQNFVPRTEYGLWDKYLTTFSSNNWNKLTPAEKAAHSLSNCQACALNSPKEQKSFPLKPTFIVNENDHVSMKSFIEKDYRKL